MKDRLHIVFIFVMGFLLPLQSQTILDTLVIGKYKFPLKKGKTHYVTSNQCDVVLPTKYTNYEKIVDIPFRRRDSTEMQFSYEVEADGTESWVGVGREFTDSLYGNSIRIYAFVDTLWFDVKLLASIKPYIKTKSGNLTFCAAKMYTIKNGTATKLNMAYIPNGKLFFNWETHPELIATTEITKDILATTIIITDFHYRIGDATYRLDRGFVVLTR